MNAQLEASLAVGNISSLAKIADAETLDMVLKAVKHHSSPLISTSVKSISLYIPTVFRSNFISPYEDLLFEFETSWI